MNLDEICKRIKSAETLNALHACREGHPLGAGRDKATLFENAWFLVAYRLGASSPEAEWLNKQTVKTLEDLR